MARAGRLVERLDNADPSAYDVVLMPDFFIDHIMRFRRLDDLLDGLQDAHGGNVNVGPQRQMVRPGGGAANVAQALARLGARTHLVAATSPVGCAYLEHTLGRDGVDLSLVRDDGALHVTGAIECGDSSVMLYTDQPHTGMSPESLDPRAWDAVARADAVYVGDWTSPRTADLAVETWRVARQTGARTYTDPGVPLEGDKRLRLLDAISSPDLDALSLNQDEMTSYAEAPRGASLVDAGRAWSRRLGARIDLHAHAESMSFASGRLLARAPHYEAALRQATGAGDTWNAGTILGDLLGLGHEERLQLANAVAALYIASERAEPPTWRELLAFLPEARPRAARA